MDLKKSQVGIVSEPKHYRATTCKKKYFVFIPQQRVEKNVPNI